MGIRIIVHDPDNWPQKNLFGDIVYERGDKMRVRLSEQIKGDKITSDLLELQLIEKNQTFKPLHQYYSLMVSGSLIDKASNSSEYIITGTVTFD